MVGLHVFMQLVLDTVQLMGATWLGPADVINAMFHVVSQKALPGTATISNIQSYCNGVQYQRRPKLKYISL